MNIIIKRDKVQNVLFCNSFIIFKMMVIISITDIFAHFGIVKPEHYYRLFNFYELLNTYRQSNNIVRMLGCDFNGRFLLYNYRVKDLVADAFILYMCTTYSNLLLCVEIDRRFQNHFCHIKVFSVQFEYDLTNPFVNVLLSDDEHVWFEPITSNTDTSSSCYVSKNIFDQLGRISQTAALQEIMARSFVVGSSFAFKLDDYDMYNIRALRWRYHLRWFFLWIREYKRQTHRTHPLDRKDFMYVIFSFL